MKKRSLLDRLIDNLSPQMASQVRWVMGYLDLASLRPDSAVQVPEVGTYWLLYMGSGGYELCFVESDEPVPLYMVSRRGRDWQKHKENDGPDYLSLGTYESVGVAVVIARKHHRVLWESRSAVEAHWSKPA